MNGTQVGHKQLLYPIFIILGICTYYSFFPLIYTFVIVLITKKNKVLDLGILITAFILGYFVIHLHEKNIQKFRFNDYIHFAKGKVFAIEDVSEQKLVFLTHCEMDDYKTKNLTFKINEANFKIGDEITFYGTVKLIDREIYGGKIIKLLNTEEEKPTWTANFRKYVTRNIESLDKNYQPLAQALITGNRNCLTYEIKQIFGKAGFGHILAISGLHIGIIALTSFKIVRICLLLAHPKVSFINIKKLSSIISILITYLYLLISGSSYSAIRAFIMSFCYFFSILFSRQIPAWQSVSIAASLILLLYPTSAFNIGFQLSFLCVGGIIFLNKALKFKKPIIKKTAILIALSFVPIVHCAKYFHYCTFNGVITNLLAIPLFESFLMPMLILHTFCGLKLPFLEEIMELIFYITKITSTLPFTVENLVYYPFHYEIILFISIFSILIIQKYIFGIILLILSLLPIINQPDHYIIVDKKKFFILDRNTGESFSSKKISSFIKKNAHFIKINDQKIQDENEKIEKAKNIFKKDKFIAGIWRGKFKLL